MGGQKGGVSAAMPEDERLREALAALNLLHVRNGVLDMPPGYTADKQINAYAWEHQGKKRAIRLGAAAGGVLMLLVALTWTWRRRRKARRTAG